MSEPLRVLVTGAAGQIAYSLLYSLAKGDVFGPDQPLSLLLLDIEMMMGVLKGVVMELQDCALPLLKEVIPTADLAVAFKDIDVAILVGAMPRKQGMVRRDLLKINVRIFKSQGEALDKYAKKTVKVVVVGNPANTNAYICQKYAPSIPAANFSALTRLDQNRAQAQIAERVGVACVNDVKNVIIWGNHSSTQYPDVRHATVTKNGKTQAVPAAVQDDTWLKGDFITTVQERGGTVLAARRISSAMSAAKAVCDHVRDWWFGTQGNDWVSMAVSSDGSYGIEKGLLFSYPVRIQSKNWTVVQGLDIDTFSQEKLDRTEKELREEKNEALEACQD